VKRPRSTLPLFAGQLAALLLLLAPLPACTSDPHKGYSFNSTFDSSIKSIHVSMFQNNTFTHGVEVELTDAIIKELQRTTPWKVTSDTSAQTTLSGTISGSRLQALSYARVSGLVQEEAVILTIEFDWKDNRTGKVLVSRREFSVADSFVPSQDVGERIEVGQNAAIQQLAHDVAAQLRSNW
jgi:hypothetical protein